MNPFRRLPASYVMILVALVAAGVYIALSLAGVIPIENLFVLMVQYTLAFIMLMVLGVVGGVFLGMVVAHRMLAERDFTPVERLTIETHAAVKEIRERLDAIDSRLTRIEEGTESIETVRTSR